MFTKSGLHKSRGDPVHAAVGRRAVAGVAGGLGLLWFMRTVPLPAAGLYSLRVLMCVVAIYAVTDAGAWVRFSGGAGRRDRGR